MRCIRLTTVGTLAIPHLKFKLCDGHAWAGQQYDKDGVRRMWWSNESQVEFNSRLQCFIDQYNQYSAEGVQV